MTLNVEQQKLVKENEKLVYYLIARKCEVEPRDYDDVCQLGMMGLCKAVSTFDPTLNRKFSTYASRCILNEIKMFYRKENKIRAKCISIDEPIDSESTDRPKDKSTFAEMLADTHNYYEDIEKREEAERRINLILNRLTVKESTVALMNMGELNQYDIGREYFNLSQSYISRLIKGVTKKLKRFEELGIENVSGQYAFSIVGEYYYRIRIYYGGILTQETYSEIRDIVKNTKVGKRRVRKTPEMIEIVMVRDSSFFEMLAKINMILYREEFSSWIHE